MQACCCPPTLPFLLCFSLIYPGFPGDLLELLLGRDPLGLSATPRDHARSLHAPFTSPPSPVCASPNHTLVLPGPQAWLCYRPPPSAPGSALLLASTNCSRLGPATSLHQPHQARLSYHQPLPHCIRLSSATNLYQTASGSALLPTSTILHQAQLCYQPLPHCIRLGSATNLYHTASGSALQPASSTIAIGSATSHASIKAIYSIYGVITELVKHTISITRSAMRS